MAVITISREYGSGGDEIAQKVCRHFKYQLFNKRMIVKAALDAGTAGHEIIDYSAENYRVRWFLNRLFNNMTDPRPASLTSEDRDAHTGEAGALAFVQKAVWNAYLMGGMVIVGRGGQMILQDLPGVLHVRIAAPLDFRIQRLEEQLKKNHRKADRSAQEIILDRDAASADYLKRYYNVDWCDPLLYHLVLNTAKVDQDQAVAMIVRMVHRLQEQEQHLAQELA